MSVAHGNAAMHFIFWAFQINFYTYLHSAISGPNPVVSVRRACLPHATSTTLCSFLPVTCQHICAEDDDEVFQEGEADEEEQASSIAEGLGKQIKHP